MDSIPPNVQLASNLCFEAYTGIVQVLSAADRRDMVFLNNNGEYHNLMIELMRLNAALLQVVRGIRDASGSHR